MRTRRFETLAVEVEPSADLPARRGWRRCPSRSDAHPSPARRAAPPVEADGVQGRHARRPPAHDRPAPGRDGAHWRRPCSTLAVLAALTSWGVLDISGAASEPAPIVSNAASD